MKKGIKRFSVLTLIAIFPIFVIVGLYLYFDPFKVLRPNDPFWDITKPMAVGSNKCFISTEAFIKHHDTEHYDSYIFGPSLSISYRADYWKQYIEKDSKVFHFDGSSDSFTGILLKMKFIIANGEKLKNALIVLDPLIFARDTSAISKLHLFAQHPDLTPQHDLLQFHWKFFKLFLDKDFISAYIDLQINGLQDYMTEKDIFTSECPKYNGIINEESYPYLDKELNTDEEGFYKKRSNQFKRNYQNVVTIKPQIDSITISKIMTMKNILAEQHTHYKIILPPMYNLTTLSLHDKEILNRIFGNENICDMSGANFISQDYHSYYDGKSHPRPQTCATVLKLAYNKHKCDITDEK